MWACAPMSRVEGGSAAEMSFLLLEGAGTWAEPVLGSKGRTAPQEPRSLTGPGNTGPEQDTCRQSLCSPHHPVLTVSFASKPAVP